MTIPSGPGTPQLVWSIAITRTRPTGFTHRAGPHAPSGPCSRPYSPECVEGEVSEVRVYSPCDRGRKPLTHKPPKGKEQKHGGPRKGTRRQRGGRSLRPDPRRLIQARLRTGHRVGRAPATPRPRVLRARLNQPQGADRGRPLPCPATLRAGIQTAGGRAGVGAGVGPSLRGVPRRRLLPLPRGHRTGRPKR